MSILVGPTIHTQLIALNTLLNDTAIRGDEESEVVHLSLRDDGVLCLYRGTVNGSSGQEYRVARDAITGLEIEKVDESLALLRIKTRENAVSVMQFMPTPGVDGDHGYSGGRHSQFGMAILPNDSQRGLDMLQAIIAHPGAQWFAELPELWQS